MTFKEAQKQLLDLADGKYCSLSFELICNRPCGTDKTECLVYLPGDGPCGMFGAGVTWGEALGELRAVMESSEKLAQEEIPDTGDDENDRQPTTQD